MLTQKSRANARIRRNAETLGLRVFMPRVVHETILNGENRKENCVFSEHGRKVRIVLVRLLDVIEQLAINRERRCRDRVDAGRRCFDRRTRESVCNDVVLAGTMDDLEIEGL